MKRLNLAMLFGVAAACGFETTAITTNAIAGHTVIPTISQEVGIRPWLGLLVLAGLAIHFYWRHLTALFRKGKQ